MTSAAASSVTHTRPGGDSPLEEEIYGFFHFPDHTCPKPSPSPKAVKKSATAVDMAKGLQNTAVRASGTKVIIIFSIINFTNKFSPGGTCYDYGIPASNAMPV